MSVSRSAMVVILAGRRIAAASACHAGQRLGKAGHEGGQVVGAPGHMGTVQVVRRQFVRPVPPGAHEDRPHPQPVRHFQVAGIVLEEGGAARVYIATLARG